VGLLVVGLSHKTAPVALLEQVALTGEPLAKLTQDVAYLPDVCETFVISTCNRVEVYAEVERFHGAVAGICELLSRYSGVPPESLTPSLYVHYEDRTVQHLLQVTSGLDSMVVGEDQILGQVRSAVKTAREHGTVGRALGDLSRAALRAGKRARSETGIDRLGVSVVAVGLRVALEGRPLEGLEVLVVGAGSMSSLTVTTLARSNVRKIVVANRTRSHAQRLAASIETAEVADLADIETAMARADLVVSCTGASGVVITPQQVRGALKSRTSDKPFVLLDLAMPRDIDPAVADVDNVRLFGMDDIKDNPAPGERGWTDAIRAVSAIVDEEFAGYLSARRAANVAPTVVALREKAAQVVDAEMNRLSGRLTGDGVSSHVFEEIAQTVHRVVDKLLHAPTVRVKELAGAPGGEDYADALRVLFDLDPRAVDAVTTATATTTDTDQEA
jgi:glutamyl-tRNA reductase